MKKYLKYKNFIPMDFVERKQESESKDNKKGYNLLILTNIILLCVNIENIFKDNNKVQEVIKPEKEYIENKELFKWINLYDENIINFKVENNRGELTYESNNDIRYLEELGLKINKVTNYENNKIVKVSYE